MKDHIPLEKKSGIDLIGCKDKKIHISQTKRVLGTYTLEL